MRIYFLIRIAFPNILTGSIISMSINEIFFYKEAKFQMPRINSFCVVDFQKEVILGDFMTFSISDPNGKNLCPSNVQSIY